VRYLARERRDQHGRIVTGNLHAVPDSGVARSSVNVVRAVNVGEEEGVEAAALERARDVDPVLEVAVAGNAAVARILPLALRLRARRALAEAVQVDHAVLPAGP
jgi:hypothetical protein